MAVQEEIDELRRRIVLLDGDKKAYSESSQWAIRQNKELISQLRAENKLLRGRLSRKMKADDDVIVEVFRAHHSRTPAELRGLTGDQAVRKFDQTVCEQIKRHNALQHVRRHHEQTLASLGTQLAQMEQETKATAATPAGESEDASQLRQLENRLDKAIIKCNEAAHIRKTYETILQKLQEERLGFDNEIAALEKAIKTRRRDLRELETVCSDAQLSLEMSKTELSRQEQSMGESRREREKVLSEYRRQAEEKKEFKEKVERRLHTRRVSLPHSSVGQLDLPADTTHEDHEVKITSYEEALAKIKDATGVSDILEVVARFLNQGATRKHLEELREENSRQLARLREERSKLQAQFEDLKYSGEAHMSSGQRMLEEFQAHLDEAKNKCAESEARVDQASRLLAQTKNGVEHLGEKLQHIKAPHTHVLRPRVSPESEEYVLEQLGSVEGKLVSLAEELASRDLDTLRREMEDEEFQHTVEGGTTGNVRIELPKAGSKSTFYDQDSGSDEEFVSRKAMKRATAALVEAKTKKKPQDDEEEEGQGKKRKRR